MAKKNKNRIVITVEEQLNMERHVRRQIDIENGSLHFKGGVHKSKKQYTRKPKHKNKENYFND